MAKKVLKRLSISKVTTFKIRNRRGYAAIFLNNLTEEIPVSDYVAAVSVGMLGGKPILDLDYDEDSTADVDMNIIMTGDGRFVEIQGTAEREPFKKEDMNKLITLAKKGIDELISAQKKVLKGII